MLIIKRSDDMYFMGTNNFDTQLRKAKIYVSLKMARNMVEILKDRKPEYDYEIIEVELREVRTVE